MIESGEEEAGRGLKNSHRYGSVGKIQIKLRSGWKKDKMFVGENGVGALHWENVGQVDQVEE